MPTERKNAPQAAARWLLASGDWHTASEFADLITDAVTDEDAERCYERLARSWGTKTDDRAERIRIGRERLAQEPLQRLVQRGEMEAAGRGSNRAYRLIRTGDTTMLAPRPKPRRESVPFERIKFPLELQMREIVHPQTGEALLFDEQWVRRLCEVLGYVTDADGKVTRDPTITPAELEPLEMVEETRKGKQPIYWAFRGFHRGEARRRCGQNSVDAIIYPGTFADAQFYALSENSKQPLPREDKDCRRAFFTLIDTPELLNRVYAAMESGGGFYRAAMAATGVSPGAINKYLKERQLCSARKGGKLIAITPESPPPPAPNLARASETKDDSDKDDDSDKQPTADTNPATTPEEPSYTAPHQARTEAQVLADAVATLKGRLELFAETVEGRWLLGLPGPDGYPFVRDDSAKLKDFFAGVEAAVGKDTFETAAQRQQRITDAEMLARAPADTPLPRGCAACVWLESLAKNLQSPPKAQGK